MEMEEDELRRIKDQEVIQDHEEEQEEIKMEKTKERRKKYFLINKRL